MFKRSSILFALVAALAMSTVPVESQAGDRSGSRHRVVKIKHAKTVKIRYAPRTVIRRAIVNVDLHRGRHRLHRQVNTYSGNVAIYHRNGVGTWSYGTTSGTTVIADARPSLKIIDIDRLAGKNDCQMEAGVCVIRP